MICQTISSDMAADCVSCVGERYGLEMEDDEKLAAIELADAMQERSGPGLHADADKKNGKPT